MSDEAEETAWAAMHEADDCDHTGHLTSSNPETNTDRECLAACIAAALRAYAEEARREERDVAAKDAEMRYEDGYACGLKDEREAWLNRAAAIEGEIADDPRHTAQEILGAHMLGASLRAEAAAIRDREEGTG